MSVASLSDSLKSLQMSLDSSSRTLIIEAAGPNRDLYLNILPMLFDLKVSYNNRDQFLQPVQCSEVDAILKDGSEVANCSSNFQIVRQDNVWTLEESESVDPLYPLKQLEIHNVRVF
jgi:hypothetical protein